MKSEAFWDWFNTEAAPKLSAREVSFRKMFNYLDSFDGPVTIVETGCARIAGNWQGDGQSSVLFDHYLKFGHPESTAHAIDLDPKATELCKGLVSARVQVHTGDSVAVLPRVAQAVRASGRKINLLYLDSYDVDWDHPTPSAVHHLKELVSIVGAIDSQTLVVVDDAPQQVRVMANNEGQLSLISQPKVGGKGIFVAEYAEQVGAKPFFSHYQVGWTGLVGN